ncbi:hypothetical protein OA099_03830 [Litorivicinus sp.]|nr:hypothetical protein [Litorivicinus sp.]MEC9076982.1 hypothetical protein [Pseudomonadota bacterium]
MSIIAKTVASTPGSGDSLVSKAKIPTAKMGISISSSGKTMASKTIADAVDTNPKTNKV